MRRYAAVLAAIVIVVLVSLALFVAWRAAEHAVANAPLTRHEEAVDLTALVTQVRDLNRLETASMHVMHIGTITQSYRMVPDSLGGDELTFLATGDVIAGIDLSRLRRTDVWREPDGTIALRLPPPQILVSRLDNSESRVLNRKTGVLRRADIDLESRMRQHAEIAIRQEALKKGILPLAANNAQGKLGDFLHTLGFNRVRFVSSGPALPPL